MRINCIPCRKDLHDQCTHDNCLCEIETEHNTKRQIEFCDIVNSIYPGVEFTDKKITNSDINDWNEGVNNIPEPSLEKSSPKYYKGMYQGLDKIDNVAYEVQQKNKFRTLKLTDEILQYDGKIYNFSLAESTIKEETEKLIPNCNTKDRNEVINKIKAQTYTDIEKFDTDPNSITLPNGILNLDTLEIKNHTHEHLSRILFPVEYNTPKFEINNETIFEDIEKNLKDTLFWKFLKNSFTVDGKFRKEDFEMVLEIMASPIIKRQIDEKATMFLGNGENGKSVCMDYITSIYGKDNISRVSLQQIAEDKFLVAELSGKAINIFTDLESNELRHASKIKAIITNEGISAQKKHKQPFVLYPICKLIFSCNRFPKVYDQSHAFFRRWNIVLWERNFENDPEKIEYLSEKLNSNQEEKNLVFSCLVHLAKRLGKNGKYTHDKDAKTIQSLWNENADPIDDFATNYTMYDELNKNKREMHKFYKKISLSKGQTPLSMGQFSKAFAEYYDEDRTNHERVWLNVAFKEPIQTILKDYDDKE